MAEALGIVSIIANVIQFVEAAKKISDAAKDAKGQPDSFRQVAVRLPLVTDILSKAKERAQTLDEPTQQLIKPLLTSCEKKAQDLHNLFDKVVKKDDDKWHDRYKKAVRSLGKGSLVERLMKDILSDVNVLASERLSGIATSDQIQELREAVQEMKEMDASLEDDTQGFTQSHSGSGDNVGLTGNSTMYLHNGSGNLQHNSIAGDAHFGNLQQNNTSHLTIFIVPGADLTSLPLELRRGVDHHALDTSLLKNCRDDSIRLEGRDDMVMIHPDMSAFGAEMLMLRRKVAETDRSAAEKPSGETQSLEADNGMSSTVVLNNLGTSPPLTVEAAVVYKGRVKQDTTLEEQTCEVSGDGAVRNDSPVAIIPITTNESSTNPPSVYLAVDTNSKTTIIPTQGPETQAVVLDAKYLFPTRGISGTSMSAGLFELLREWLRRPDVMWIHLYADPSVFFAMTCCMCAHLVRAARSKGLAVVQVHILKMDSPSMEQVVEAMSSQIQGFLPPLSEAKIDSADNLARFKELLRKTLGPLHVYIHGSQRIRDRDPNHKLFHAVLEALHQHGQNHPGSKFLIVSSHKETRLKLHMLSGRHFEIYDRSEDYAVERIFSIAKT